MRKLLVRVASALGVAVLVASCAAGSEEGVDVVPFDAASPEPDASAGTDDSRPDGASPRDAAADAPREASAVLPDAGPDAGPCDGVTCTTPPPNECTGSNLKVWTAQGSCIAGQCSYTWSTQPCANGCESGRCRGNPCAGVTCANPPPNRCRDGATLETFEPSGTCTDGNCSYASRTISCPRGCDSETNRCIADPCAGVTCNRPPAASCLNENTRRVFDPNGTCNQGTCSYDRTDVPCGFGCDPATGACRQDPCAGTVCNRPPAATCVDANTRRTFAPTGTCSAGVCSYAPQDSTCPRGCVNGVCVECNNDGECGAGRWCSQNRCVDCNDANRCGATCTRCNPGSLCSQGTCLECINDNNCGAGRFCSSGTCLPCNTNARCGASCGACSGATPVCGGNACQCQGNSCGNFNRCVNGGCQKCNTAAACGASCTACGGATPVCKDEGATTRCVECTDNSHCPTGKTCSASNTCVDGCATPAGACTTGNQNMRGCANARVISRVEASAASGREFQDNTCSAPNSSDLNTSECSLDGAGDHTYKIWVRRNESIIATMGVRRLNCTGEQDEMRAVFKVFRPTAACGDTCGGTPALCSSPPAISTRTFAEAARQDGWYYFVVDGDKFGVFPGKGYYTLNVRLSNCAGGTCTCQ